jgi:4'-phosphopantetheinyl transferase
MNILIRLLNIKEVEEHEKYILSTLDKERFISANKYVHREDYLRSLGAGYLINKYTSSSPLRFNKYHKPYKDDCYFNVSHSSSYIAFISYKDECGIDIEEIKEIREKALKYSFNDEQLLKIKSPFDFYKSWTLKEALGKADGRGLSYNIKDIPVSTGKVLYVESVYYNYCTQYDNYIISVSVKNIEAEGLDIIIENIKESQ